MNEHHLRNTSQAAAFLGVSRALLEKWRCYGGGPSFVKIGKNVRYSQPALEDFIAQCTVSASDNASNRHGRN